MKNLAKALLILLAGCATAQAPKPARVEVPVEDRTQLQGTVYSVVNQQPYEYRFYDRNNDGTTDLMTVRPFQLIGGVRVMPECPLGYIVDENLNGVKDHEEFYIDDSCGDPQRLDDYVRGMTEQEMLDNPYLDWARENLYKR